MLPGKLPSLLAADDSSQILNRSLDRSSVRKEPTMGGVSHQVRGIQVFTPNLQTNPCLIGWTQEFVLSRHPFQPLKIAGVHDHDRDHRV